MFIKPNPTYVSFRAYSKDGQRNAIAMLERTTFEEAERQVHIVLESAGISFEVNRFSPRGEPIHTSFVFTKEPVIHKVGAKNYYPAIFIERAVVGKGEKFSSLHSEDTFIVWISFVLKKKALTEWRRKLIPLFLKANLNDGGAKQVAAGLIM